MKRTTWLVAVVVACTSTRVYAADHGARINEILLSKNNDATVQYIEVTDTFGGEPYPNSPYTLAIFDAAGAPVGNVALTLLGFHTGWYIASPTAATAFSIAGNDALTVALPLNGQACFQKSPGNINISCVAWGCITHLVAVGTVRTPAPTDNLSAQRQIDGTFQIATPTPNAANIVGTTMAACPTDPVDMPPDASVPHDVFDPSPDAPIHDPNSGGGGGCCNIDGRGTAGAIVLALGTLVVLRRSRRA